MQEIANSGDLEEITETSNVTINDKRVEVIPTEEAVDQNVKRLQNKFDNAGLFKVSENYSNANSNKEDGSDWFDGPSDWVQYMKNVYTPFHERNLRTSNTTIVYEKKGTTGMAGQLFGVCDSLLLGVLHNRSVQSTDSNTMNSSYCSFSPLSLFQIPADQFYLSF